MEFGLKADLSRFSKGLNEIQRKQLPFATAQALTAIAGHVGIGWQGEMESVLDRPTPFTLNSVSVRPARKSAPVATVYVKDIAAEYLAPYVDGGPRFLGQKKGLLGPKAVRLNQYGNLPKGKVAALKAKPGVFVGAVKLKNGQTIGGVWQRRAAPKRTRGGPDKPAALQLLIRFTDPKAPEQRLELKDVAVTIAAKVAEPEFAKALAFALRTAR